MHKIGGIKIVSCSLSTESILFILQILLSWTSDEPVAGTCRKAVFVGLDSITYGALSNMAFTPITRNSIWVYDGGEDSS